MQDTHIDLLYKFLNAVKTYLHGEVIPVERTVQSRVGRWRGRRGERSLGLKSRKREDESWPPFCCTVAERLEKGERR